MSIEKEREAFEAYYIANHHDGDIHPNQQLLEWSEKGEFYFATSVNDLWDMWQASANRQGYKLAPVEPTDHMKCVVRDFDPDIEDYANMDKSEWENLCADIYKAIIGVIK